MEIERLKDKEIQRLITAMKEIEWKQGEFEVKSKKEIEQKQKEIEHIKEDFMQKMKRQEQETWNAYSELEQERLNFADEME